MRGIRFATTRREHNRDVTPINSLGGGGSTGSEQEDFIAVRSPPWRRLCYRIAFGVFQEPAPESPPRISDMQRSGLRKADAWYDLKGDYRAMSESGYFTS